MIKRVNLLIVFYKLTEFTRFSLFHEYLCAGKASLCVLHATAYFPSNL